MIANLVAASPSIRIAHFAGDRAAAISYTFDDGLRDQYTHAVPMLNEFGFKGTFFVIPGRVAPSVAEAERRQNDKRAWGGITWAELREMSAQGHEIASHTWSHRALPKLAPEEVESELSKAFDAIKNHIDRPPLTIAFPFNQSTAEIKITALKYHVASRNYQTGVGGAKTTLEWFNNWADKQVREHTWGIIMAHGIERGYAAFTDPEIFREHLRCVKNREKEIWVDTFANVARYARERDDASVAVSSYSQGRLECVLSGSLDPAVYDVPLTLIIDVPGVVSASARRSGSELPVGVGRGMIQVDAAPSREPVVVTWQ